MPFQMKVQPIDTDAAGDAHARRELPLPSRPAAEKPLPVFKSRLRKLFDRQFPSVLKNNNTAEKQQQQSSSSTGFAATAAVAEAPPVEPSSVVLAKMVQNYIEEGTERPNNRFGRNRCNCFNGNGNDSSDDEFDMFGSGDSLNGGSFSDAADALKNLIPCATVAERAVLAEAAKIAEKNKAVKRKDDLRKIVAAELSSNGFNASICKSKWEKCPSYPAGEYEYIDVVVEGQRLLVDIDFRSEFEIARPTSNYKSVLQSLPFVFVGKSDRMAQIIAIVAEAAKQSLKKKAMHIPPWRKAEYMRAKWLSETYTRAENDTVSEPKREDKKEGSSELKDEDEVGELDLIFGDKTTPSEEEASKAPVMTWQPPAVKPKQRGGKIVPGLAALLKDKA